jgi:membrane peptidoglycan carboxypeptidase
MDETPSLALGTVATSPLELTLAYVPFATLGRTRSRATWCGWRTRTGACSGQAGARPSRQALDPAVAYIVTDILRDAVNHGTGTAVRGAGFRGAVAGKTGTTNNATDVWFVGYTPELVGTVWIGYDRPTPLGAGATGGGFAAPVWGRIMRQVYADRPAPPDGSRRPGRGGSRRIDPWHRPGAGRGVPPALRHPATTEIFLARHVPGHGLPLPGRR